MTKNCDSCRWFKPGYKPGEYIPGEPMSEAPGFCEWPSDRLPFSLRDANFMREMVRPIDGATCSCHEFKTQEDENAPD